MTNVFKVDGHEFDLDTLPQVGLLASRAIAHIIRNEAASTVRAKLIGEARDAKRKRTGESKAELTDDERKAIKFDAESIVHKALYTEAQAEKAALIREGKIGEAREGGPRKSEFEKRLESLVKRAVVADLQSKKKLWVGQKKFPAMDQVFKYAERPEGRTFADMVDGFTKSPRGVALAKHVQKQLDDEMKLGERVAKADEGEAISY